MENVDRDESSGLAANNFKRKFRQLCDNKHTSWTTAVSAKPTGATSTKSTTWATSEATSWTASSSSSSWTASTVHTNFLVIKDVEELHKDTRHHCI